MHHPPYTSGNKHGAATAMRWDFKAWGANLVIDGHEHVYERIERPNGLTYITNGLWALAALISSDPLSIPVPLFFAAPPESTWQGGLCHEYAAATL